MIINPVTSPSSDERKKPPDRRLEKTRYFTYDKIIKHVTLKELISTVYFNTKNK